jgi:hypothetical protein
MIMIYHGDHDDMLFDEPKFFDTVSEAIAYAEAKVAKGLPQGHALTLYRCAEQRVFEAVS